MTISHRQWCFDTMVGLAVLAIDRLTKYMALWWLSPGVPLPVGSLFGIDWMWTLTFNTGAAWGVGSDMPFLLLLSRVVFMGLLCLVYVRAHLAPLARTALAMILAGAGANIVDTLLWGHVVDMVHLRFWGWDYPVFNVADIAICLGAGLFVLQTLLTTKSGRSG